MPRQHVPVTERDERIRERYERSCDSLGGGDKRNYSKKSLGFFQFILSTAGKESDAPPPAPSDCNRITSSILFPRYILSHFDGCSLKGPMTCLS